MTINDEEISNYRLENWIEVFGSIYRDADAERNASSLWLDVIEQGSNLAEYIRREEYKKAIDKIPDVFCHLLRFIHKYSLDSPEDAIRAEGIDLRPDQVSALSLTEWILKKYPTVCSVCAVKPCICPSSRYEREKRNQGFSLEDTIGSRLKKHKTWENEIVGKSHSFDMEKMFNMFNEIYGGVQHDPPLSAICFHFLEEVGEVAELLISFNSIQIIRAGSAGSYDENLKCLNNDLKSELSDVVSWTMALINKVNHIFRSTYPHHQCAIRQDNEEKKSFESITLSQLLLNRYYDESQQDFICPYCKSTRCTPKCRQDRLMKKMEKRLKVESDLLHAFRKAMNQERRKATREKVKIQTRIEGEDAHIVDISNANLGFLSNAEMSLNDVKDTFVDMNGSREQITFKVTRPTNADKKETGYRYFYGAEIVNQSAQPGLHTA